MRASAFEALSEVILAVGGQDCYPVMEQLLRMLISLLTQSFSPSQQPSEEIFQFQGLICGCLNNLIDRLGLLRLESMNVTDSLFELFVKVIETGLMAAAASGNNPGVSAGGVEGLGSSEERAKVGSEEDAILAIGTLIRSTLCIF